MAYKILSVSILEDKIDILKLEQGMTNAYGVVSPPRFDVDEKELDRAASWADQIFINVDFPMVEYQWQIFPNTSNRVLRQLVARKAAQLIGRRQKVRFGFRHQGPVTIDGIGKQMLSFIAIEEGKVSKWENAGFEKYKKKISCITSTPIALCGAVVQSEHPNKDFMVVWVGEYSTIFAISSPQGDVKVARNIPVGLSRETDHEDENDVLESFVEEFDRDILTTLLVYNDTVDEPSCDKFFLLGNNKLENIIQRFPLESVGEDYSFHLENLAVRNLQLQEYPVYHLAGNLFCRQDYNLLDPAIRREQKFDDIYKYASIVLVGCIIIALGWMFATAPLDQSSKKEQYAGKLMQLEQVKKRLFSLETEEMQLARYRGWKEFYKNTYTNQPAWSEMFSDLAKSLPAQFIINELEIFPGKNQGIYGWTCFLRGQINTAHWNEGLKMLRLFGIRVERSPFFSIVDVKYAPKEDEKKTDNKINSFDFTIKMQLTPRDTKEDAR